MPRGVRNKSFHQSMGSGRSVKQDLFLVDGILDLRDSLGQREKFPGSGKKALGMKKMEKF
jgi:hypothetical protein